jgi:hypothetical protein
MNPRGVDLEITEQRPTDQPLGGDTSHTVVAPNHVVINGLPVLVPSDTHITIDASDKSCVTANLTVLVHRLRVHPEHESPVDDSDPPIFEQLETELGRIPALAALIFAARQELGQQIRGHAGYTLRDIQRLREQIEKCR